MFKRIESLGVDLNFVSTIVHFSLFRESLILYVFFFKNRIRATLISNFFPIEDVCILASDFLNMKTELEKDKHW